MIVGRQIEHGGRTLQVLECQVTQRTSQPFTTNAGGYMIGNVVNPPTTTTPEYLLLCVDRDMNLVVVSIGLGVVAKLVEDVTK